MKTSSIKVSSLGAVLSGLSLLIGFSTFAFRDTFHTLIMMLLTCVGCVLVWAASLFIFLFAGFVWFVCLIGMNPFVLTGLFIYYLIRKTRFSRRVS